MTEEGAAELYKHRDDPGEWDDQPVEIDVRPGGSEVVSFRIPTEELDSVTEAARVAGESLSQFVRGALSARLKPPMRALARTVTSGPLARHVSASPHAPGVYAHPGAVSVFVLRSETGADRHSVTSCEGVVAAG
ncbi:hypothetical protein [Candidatus Poriferisodalis sp.]|uniref:hypothetical protein n=1 Tax=Candidatus Poriferisodalis sp. TaxID=3101277 RepID=UPI003B5A8F17